MGLHTYQVLNTQKRFTIAVKTVKRYYALH